MVLLNQLIDDQSFVLLNTPSQRVGVEWAEQFLVFSWFIIQSDLKKNKTKPVRCVVTFRL